jgi:hypothetical protein
MELHIMCLFPSAFLLTCFLQCDWIHTVSNGNFASDLTDTVVYFFRCAIMDGFCDSYHVSSSRAAHAL